VVETGHGRDYSAVSFWRGHDYSALDPASTSGVTVHLFDKQWRPIGELKMPPPAKKPLERAQVAWDSEGLRLAVLIEDCGLVGLVTPPSLDVHTVVVLDDYGSDSALPRIFWQNEKKLILVYESRFDIVVRRVDVATGQHPLLHRQEQGVARQGYLDKALLSPDGRYLAFDRMPYFFPPKCSIWLLDCRTGECSELTYEDAQDYHHGLLRWEGERTILFHRKTETKTKPMAWDLYRAHLNLPVSAAPETP